MFILSSVSNGLELCSENHSSMCGNFLGEMSSN